MTREETISLITDNAYFNHDTNSHIVDMSFAVCVIDKIFNDHKAQLKAKDEEVEKAYMIGYRNGYSDAYDASEMCKLGFTNPFDRIDKKARSIVSMLFWEMKKASRSKARGITYSDGWDKGEELMACKIFKKAYKMLKEI